MKYGRIVVIMALIAGVLASCKNKDDYYEQCNAACLKDSREAMAECRKDTVCREEAINRLRGCDRQCLSRWKQ